jgi:plasmid maintenance system antidote protein VapI
MGVIAYKYQSWKELKSLIDMVREDLKISSKKVTQIINDPRVCTNEELIIIANRLNVKPYTLMEFGLGEDRISEAEKAYHKTFFTISKHYEQLRLAPKTFSYPSTASG